MSDTKKPPMDKPEFSEDPADDDFAAEEIATSVTGEGAKAEPVESLPEGARAVLQIEGGPDAGKSFTLVNARNTIGRLRENDVVLTGDAVSTLHAMVFYSKEGEWRIEDLDSTNGTRLNSSTVKEFGLRFGDEISIGEHLLRFTMPG